MKSEFEDLKKIEEELKIQNLFRAAVLLAAKDAYGPKAEARKNAERRQDALCFFQNKRDLKIICLLAGVNDEDILSIVENKKLKNKEKYNKIKASF